MNTLSITPLSEERRVMVNHKFVARRFLKGKLRKIVVYKGFVSDGGSIPRLLWTTTLTPFDPRAIAEFIIHDDAYRNAALTLETAKGTRILGVTRKEADKLLRDGLKQAGINLYLRNKVYWGLRAGGWVAWNNHRRAQK